jgi:hypothetical protein
VIGKIVLTMLVAAAKINQSSFVLAFDQRIELELKGMSQNWPLKINKRTKDARC